MYQSEMMFDPVQGGTVLQKFSQDNFFTLFFQSFNIFKAGH